jgi:hypothetical protein
MIALLSSFGSTQVSFATTVGAVFSGRLATTALTPAQVLDDRPRPSGQVFARAHERGVLAIVDDLFMPLVAINRPQ